MVLAFNLQRASGQRANETVAAAFGAPFDPFMNDQNYVLSVLSLEEVGARGNKVSMPAQELARTVVY